MAKGRKTPKINLLLRANNPPSSNDVTETRSEFQKPACAGNGYRKATAQIPADDDIIYLICSEATGGEDVRYYICVLTVVELHWQREG